MKLLLIPVLFLSLETHAKSLLCSKKIVKTAVATAKAHAKYDKNRHCVTSCLISLQCSLTSARAIGIGKEILDVFDHGDPDIKDWKADKVGIDAVKHKYATNTEECFQVCDNYYPPKRK